MSKIAHFIRFGSLIYILLLATVLYFFLATFTYHPDNKLVLKWAGADEGRVFNIWSYGEKNYPKDAQFNYPPAHFYLDKIQYFIAKPLAGEGYDQWLNAPNDQDSNNQQLAHYSFATKVGLILITILSGYLVFQLVISYSERRETAALATALWLLNPITLYSVPIMGQNDVMAICFFLAGWLVLKRSSILATIFFGLGTSVKMIPLVWLPFLLALSSYKKWSVRIGIFLGSVGVYVLTLLPFIQNETFRNSVLQNNQNERFLYSQLSLGFAEAVNIVLVLLLICLAGALSKYSSVKTTLGTKAFVLMTVNILMLSFTHFHPQWWTWVSVFWAMWITTVDSKKLGIAIAASTFTFLSWLIVVLLFNDRSLVWGILLPLNTSLANLPPLQQILEQKNVNTLQLINLAYSWLAGIGITAVVLLFTEVAAQHKALTLPKWITQIVRFLFVTNHFVRKIVTIILLSLVLLTASFLANSIPAPLGSSPPSVKNYLPLTDVYTVGFTAQSNNLSRVDISLDNYKLQSQGTYSFDLLSGEQKLYSQQFSTLNVGNPSQVRFDVPVQTLSKAKNYTVVIAPVAEFEEGQLLIGVTNVNEPSTSPAIQTFYSEGTNESSFYQSVVTAVTIVKAHSLLFILLLISILLFL